MRVRTHCDLACSAACLGAAASAALSENSATRVGVAAFGDWRTDAPGVRRKLTPADLPAPLASRPVANPSREVARPAGALPKVPAGFAVSLFAKGLKRTARRARRAQRRYFRRRKRRGTSQRVARRRRGLDRRAHRRFSQAGLRQPFGVAFYPPGPDPAFVYVAATERIVRFPYKNGDLTAAGPPETIAASLPAGGSHWTRDIAFSPDGKTMFVSVGSASNDAEEMNPLSRDELAAFAEKHALGAAWGDEENRADVLAFDPDGRNRRVFATGLRNCSGLAVQPENSALWCVVNERDILGDDLPPGLCDQRPGRRFLRLALVLYRRQRGPRP